MQRRELIAAAALLASGVAFAEKTTPEGGGLSNLIIGDAKLQSAIDKVRATAFACAQAGEDCVRHCIEQTSAGEGKDFARCLAAAQQMKVLCQAVGQLASLRAASLKEVLEACINSCERCRIECARHEAHFAMGHHLECKKCMESCISCRDACMTLKTLI